MLGAHVFVTFRDARAGLIERVGQNGYRALFSIVSIVGLALIVWGYGNTARMTWCRSGRRRLSCGTSPSA